MYSKDPDTGVLPEIVRVPQGPESAVRVNITGRLCVANRRGIPDLTFPAYIIEFERIYHESERSLAGMVGAKFQHRAVDIEVVDRYILVGICQRHDLAWTAVRLRGYGYVQACYVHLGNIVVERQHAGITAANHQLLNDNQGRHVLIFAVKEGDPLSNTPRCLPELLDRNLPGETVLQS